MCLGPDGLQRRGAERHPGLELDHLLRADARDDGAPDQKRQIADSANPKPRKKQGVHMFNWPSSGVSLCCGYFSLSFLLMFLFGADFLFLLFLVVARPNDSHFGSVCVFFPV